MPATTPGDSNNKRFSIELPRALLTPSASPLPPPHRPPAKRPRLRSTPSSSISATPSTSNESSSSAEVNSARRASTLRVLNVWAQLAERYNKRLDEDDIVDLYSGAIIKDRGVVKGASRDYHIGHFAQPDDDQDYPDADQDQEDSEQDDDDNELNALPPSEATTDDDAPISKKELLRGVPPLSATTDAEDLREFLEAEKKRRELAGDDEDEEDLSPEQLSAIRKALEEESRAEVAATENQAQDGTSVEHSPERQVDGTPTRPSAPLGDESEDELALWTHDESTAVYPVVRDQSEQDAQEVDQEVVELTELDSDEEFNALLTRPPRFTQSSPLPISRPKDPRQLLQSPPDSERGRANSRTRPRSKIKSKAEVTPRSENRPRSPLVHRKHEVVLTLKGKPSGSKVTGTVSSDAERSDQEVVTPTISRGHKGKCKKISPPVDDNRRDKTPKFPEAVSRGRKRKRIASSTSGGPLAQSPAKTKSSSCSRGKPTSQSPTTLSQPDGPDLTLDQGASTPVRFVDTIPGSSSSSAVSKTQQPTLSTPAYRSLEPESVQPTSHSYNSSRSRDVDLPITVTHPYSQRHPSHPLSVFPSPNQGTPGPSLTGHLPQPPPIDPVQTQQTHYLLAQMVQQLSYLISATMPPYTAYASNPNPGQPWQHPPPPPPPHAAYGTPIHHPSHFHGSRPYYTPSSSVLPPSSPVQSSMSPPAEERRARSRGRSKSRGRRVSFKLDSEEVVVREHTIQPEPQHSGQKNRKQILEAKREKGKGRATEEFDDAFRLDERGSQEVARGRTPGPPSRKISDLSRGRSLSRR